MGVSRGVLVADRSRHDSDLRLPWHGKSGSIASSSFESGFTDGGTGQSWSDGWKPHFAR